MTGCYSCSSCRAAFRHGGSPRQAWGQHKTRHDNPIATPRSTRVANIKSQMKRIKTNEKARLRNKAVKSSVKTAIRKFREAAEAGDKDQALAALQDASKKLDKA